MLVCEEIICCCRNTLDFSPEKSNANVWGAAREQDPNCVGGEL